ncbi:MAG: alcohol dehydrogenase, partial [Propionicimonas sp.]
LMLGENASAPLPWDRVVSHELRVAGSHGMAAVDYPAMLDLVASGRLDPAALVASVIGFDALPAALAAMDAPDAGPGGLVVAALVPEP